jgi:hypothetical protein
VASTSEALSARFSVSWTGTAAKAAPSWTAAEMTAEMTAEMMAEMTAETGEMTAAKSKSSSDKFS